MTERKRGRIRLTLALLFGLLVTAVASTSIGGARSHDVRFEQSNTGLRLERINAALAKYRGQNNGYPQRLSALKLDSTTAQDGWERAWIYSRVNGSPLVESLGRDGRRGGFGTDADLSNVNSHPPQMRVPLWMRAQEEDARMMVVSALFCGLLSGVLTLAALEKVKFEPGEMMILVPTFLTALALAAFGAAVITLLHMPSGH